MNKNRTIAKYFLKRRLSVIPLNKDKSPAIRSWKEYQHSLIDNPDNHEWDGIGLIVGKCNGNVEAIDVDTKYDITGTLWDNLKLRLSEVIPGILDKVVIAKTISGGYHILYKCDKIEGNQKLASRPATSAELANNPNEKNKAVIETRGEGGYVVAAPTHGYELLNGKYTFIPKISVTDRDTIISVCKSFTEVEEVKFTYGGKSEDLKTIDEDPNNPFKVYNEKGNVKELLTSHGWKYVRRDQDNDYYLRPGNTTAKTSGNWSSKHNLFYCFSSSAGLPTEQPLDLSELYTQLECAGDKTKAYKQLVKEGYGSYPVKKQTSSFWYFSKSDNVVLDLLQYSDFLADNGFHKYYKNDAEKPTFIRIVSNVVSLTSPEMIKDFVLGWLEKNKHMDVKSFCIGFQKMFEEKFLTCLNTIEIKTLIGDVDKDYICFRNGVVQVSKNMVRIISYNDIDGYIWKKHIIQRDFVAHKDFKNDYQKFIEIVSVNEAAPLESAIGYLIATYKDKSNNKAIILNDASISDSPEGGSGKGLLVQGVREIRRSVIIDGKNWTDKQSFPYQAVDEDTQILFFDDVKKRFNFEDKFSIVTEGITVEKKNKQSFFIPVERSPKLVITTNYAVEGTGNSHERRKLEFELAKVYGRDREPKDDFGCLLFTDWDELQWQRFDNYMVFCLQQYIVNGIIEQKGTNIRKKRLINSSRIEFVDWAEKNLPINTKLHASVTLNKFFIEYPHFKGTDAKGHDFITAMKWSIWLKAYADFLDCKYDSGRDTQGRWCMFMVADSKNQVGNEMPQVGIKHTDSDDLDEELEDELPF